MTKSILPVNRSPFIYDTICNGVIGIHQGMKWVDKSPFTVACREYRIKRVEFKNGSKWDEGDAIILNDRNEAKSYTLGKLIHGIEIGRL